MDGLIEKKKRSLTPRELIGACALRWGQEEDIPPPPGDFAKKWVELRDKRLKKPDGASFDEVVAKGLPWLVDLLAGKSWQLHYTRLADIKDVNLMFEPTQGGRPLAVSFIHQSPKELTWRLKRLLKDWPTARGKSLDRLVLVRPMDPAPTQNACQQIADLEATGARVVYLSSDQYAELAAYQAMFTAAQKGELARAGQAVDATEYSKWVKTHLTDSVKKLLRDVFAPVAAAPAPAVAATPPAAVSAPVAPPTAPPPAAAQTLKAVAAGGTKKVSAKTKK